LAASFPTTEVGSRIRCDFGAAKKVVCYALPRIHPASAVYCFGILTRSLVLDQKNMAASKDGISSCKERHPSTAFRSGPEVANQNNYNAEPGIFVT
jgi:hypothetical protein